MKHIDIRLVPENDTDRRVLTSMVCDSLKDWKVSTDSYWCAEIRYRCQYFGIERSDGTWHYLEEHDYWPNENGFMSGSILLLGLDNTYVISIPILFSIVGVLDSVHTNFSLRLTVPDFLEYGLKEEYDSSFCIPMKKLEKNYYNSHTHKIPWWLD
jgi:hypothetical protein